MRVWKRLLRILRATMITVATLLLVALVFIQIQQRLLRHRAERLLADYKTLQLGHTSWPEAQAFIHRWQHWGYASQPCDATYCSYTVNVSDTVSMHLPNFSERGWRGIQAIRLPQFMYHLGYRSGGITVDVTVANGLLIGDHVAVMVVVPESGEYGPYELGMSVRSQPNLASEKSNFNYEAQIIDHPDYFVSRPGGCEGCMFGWIHFAPGLSNKDRNQLNDFQLDCFTRRKSCEFPQDLLPVVARYHLYDHDPRSAPLFSAPPVCAVPAKTLARDAHVILIIDALSTEPHKLGPYEERDGYAFGEHVKVSWVEVLKGDVPAQARAIKTFMPFPGWRTDYLDQAPEHLVPGQRYIVFWSETANEGVATMDRCGFVPDTPQNRQLVLAGIAQDAEFESPKLHYDLE